MLDSLKPALVITRREVRDQLRDWRIIFPVLGLTLFFPFLMNFTAQQMLSFVNRYGATILGVRLVPFLLMIVGFFPISVSLVIALESFVGEKERGSIEPLLNTPLEDWQLYLGKLLAVTAPPLTYSFIGMGVYLVGLWLKDIPWPEPALLLQIVVLTTVQAVMMVSGAVVVSSQATSIRSANLLASFIIIPSALLIQGESLAMFWGNYWTLWWAVLGVLVLSVLLVRVGLAHFQREELLGRDLDVLNVRWMWSVFTRSFTGGARSVGEWYRHLLRSALPEMSRSVLVIIALAAAGIVLGLTLVPRYPVTFDSTATQEIGMRMQEFVSVWPVGEVNSVALILWQNVRVLVLAMIIGVFSLGILGVLPLFATMVVSGYLLGTLSANGIPALTYLGLILPHGVVEIPASIVATAAVLQMGAVLATPRPEKTVGEVWLVSLANWMKLMVGLVIPLLIAAAIIEAWITPRIAWMLLR